MAGSVIAIDGPAASGKSTIAYALVQKRLRNCLIIDGDKHREMQFLNEKLGFTKSDIMRNNEHVIKLARFAQGQGINVLISQIAPYRQQRCDMRKKLENFHEVLLNCDDKTRASRPNFKESELVYEFDTADLALFTYREDLDTCVDRILEYLE